MAAKYSIICKKCGKETLYRAKGCCSKCYYKEYGKAYSKKRREKYREIILKKEKEYREKNKEMLRFKSMKTYEKYKAENLEYLKSILELKCEKCGYDRCFSALEFHHCIKSQKEGSSDCVKKWFANRPNHSFRKKLESIKFKILCANCHRELHESEFQLKGEL